MGNYFFSLTPIVLCRHHVTNAAFVMNLEVDVSYLIIRYGIDR